jgi:hypothetical protein
MNVSPNLTLCLLLLATEVYGHGYDYLGVSALQKDYLLLFVSDGLWSGPSRMFRLGVLHGACVMCAWTICSKTIRLSLLGVCNRIKVFSKQ